MRYALVLLFAVLPAAAAEPPGVLKLNLRTRVRPFKGSDAWEEVVFRKELPAKETALLICDMWDDHWCKSAAKRCGELARNMAPVIAAARAKGVQIIHAPSDCMDFYKDTPQRRRIQNAPKIDLPQPLALPDPPLPVDTTGGGCDDDSTFRKAWTRQTAAIPIADNDVISDKGDEVYRFLKQRGIKNLLVVGVHTNMCVLHRTFAIKQMTRWGIRCVLARDLTDAMYDPKKPPMVGHEKGTELVIEYIEKYWAPTMLSKDLLP